MRNLVVTTPGRPTDTTVNKAKITAGDLSIPYVKRNKQSIYKMMEEHNSNVIVTADQMTVHTPDMPPFFFHPNAAMFRAKRWLKTKEDPLTDVCRLKDGDVFFDATMGMGSDAIIASLAVGTTGKVIGSEVSPLIAYIVKEGLKSYDSNVIEVNEAMRRIKVLSAANLDWLEQAADNTADVVYFDPMFQEAVAGSTGFDPMRPYALTNPLTGKLISEALRVARKRVVLKDHFRSHRFQQFGFKVQVRPSATYHFGTIELKD